MTIKTLSVASECAPFIKTGGLADVVSALAKVLGAHGVACRVLLPLYPALTPLAAKAREVMAPGEMFGGPVRVLATEAEGIELLLIDAPHLYDRDGQIYLDTTGRDWPDNPQRFALLSRIAAMIAREGVEGWTPDLVHAHDWQAGLVPVYLRQDGAGNPPCILTIHNIAFQGNFPPDLMGLLGLDPAGYTQDGFEYFGQIGFLKGGLLAADRITTVSPTYARELLTPEFGMGLEGVLNARRADLNGVLNGIDTALWDPATDTALARNYSSRTLARKAENKAALLARFGLEPEDGADKPLFCAISRLSEQKGLDVALQVLPEMLDAGARFVLLGSGSPDLERGYADLAARYPARVGVEFGFNEDLAHLMQAGSDAILIPSRFEPCGLTQLYAMRYGTLPIVARTGGLADTVIDANTAALATGCGTGFQFAPMTAAAFSACLWRAWETYDDRPAWQKLMRNAMKQPVGWDVSAAQIAQLYADVIGS